MEEEVKILLIATFFSWQGNIHEVEGADHCFSPHLAQGDNLMVMEKLTLNEYIEWMLCIAEVAKARDKEE